jgi:FKBP-type peptidyl-prolyl cis-trans isomerase
MESDRYLAASGLRFLIVSGAAAAIMAASGCRDESAQPQPETGAGQVDLDLAPEEPGTVSSAEAIDPGATRPEGDHAGHEHAEGEAESPAEPPAADPGVQAGEGEEAVNRRELESGLIIEDLVIGDGDEAPPGATVTIHYEGRLTDGTPFASSHEDGEPATYALGQLIRGWQEGIPGMREGGKRRLRIPHQLAYGERGRPPKIPARADLVFVIELLEVK